MRETDSIFKISKSESELEYVYLKNSRNLDSPSIFQNWNQNFVSFPGWIMKFENMEWLWLLCNLIFYHFQRAKRNLKMKSIEDYAYAALLFLRIFPVLFISYNRSISVDATANSISLQSFHVSCQTYKYISFPRPSSLNDSLSSLIGDKVWYVQTWSEKQENHI